MKAKMKFLDWIAWISVGSGVILMILAVLSSVIPHYVKTETNILGVDHRINYFTGASTLFLITIAVFVYQIRNRLENK